MLSHQTDFDHELKNELNQLLNNVPILYKYFDIEGAFKLVSNSSILFRKPSTFNDPYDCHPSLVDMNDMPDSEVERLINLYFNNQHDDERRGNSISNFNQIRNDMTDLLKAKLFDIERNTRGISCFSKSFDNLLMWAQYAESHTGICIGFHLPKLYLDIRNSAFPEIALLGVKYISSFERLKFFDNKKKAILNWLRTKSNHWKYEEEVRISLGPHDYHDSEYFLVPFNINSISDIYFGSKSPDDSALDFIKLCKKAKLKVCFNKMELSPNSFELRYHEV